MLFQIVREFSFIQESKIQVTEWFSNAVHGVYQSPRWDFGWTQRFIDSQVFNILPAFKEAYEPKAEQFLFNNTLSDF